MFIDLFNIDYVLQGSRRLESKVGMCMATIKVNGQYQSQALLRLSNDLLTYDVKNVLLLTYLILILFFNCCSLSQ